MEAGAVLGDLCHEAAQGNYDMHTTAYAEAVCGERIPARYHAPGGALAQQIVMLRQSHRFGGPIGQLASAVNTGDATTAIALLRAASAQILAWDAPAQASAILPLALDGREGAAGGYLHYLRIVSQRHQYDAYDAWAKAALQAFDQFRLLCAVREGPWGVTGLNLAIEQKLVTAGHLQRRGEWYVGRPVMITRNDDTTGVYNGEIGLTLPDPARPDALRVYFLDGDTLRSVLATRLRDVETAYAMTVHKSQGSEFHHTVLVLPPTQQRVLTRELVYTGITRARECFTLIAPDATVLVRAIAQCTRRESGLRQRLSYAVKPASPPSGRSD